MFHKIELHELVPPVARAVRLSYEFETADCGAQLCRIPEDAHPVLLDVQRGELVLDLIEPEWIFYRLLDGSSPLHISVTGYEL